MDKGRFSRAWAVAALSLATMMVCGEKAVAAEHGSDSYAGVTRPSEERALSFSFPGVVQAVMVKEGERVKKGQPLIKLDDRIDRNALEAMEVEAKSSLKVEYAKKSRDQKNVHVQRLRELQKEDAAATLEVEDKVLEAELAVTQLALSEEESQTSKLKAEGQRIKVELATRTSTIDGLVQKINVREGEYADPQQSQRAAVIVVQNDPLKVEVFLPVAAASGLTDGQQLEVAYPESNEWKKAKITFFDPVADPGSGMRRLYLEMPNPENREAGLQVKVRVPGQ